MKGVILAGGSGTRLYPLTAVTNKHLVPVGNLPMIEYPLFTLRRLGISSLHTVTGGEHFQAISGYLATTHPDLNSAFYYQQRAGGIAEALSLVEGSVTGHRIAVILGDNVFEENFRGEAEEFAKSRLGAMFFLKKVPDPQRFGVAEVCGDKVVSIEEKPQYPKSDLAVAGLYFYDETVFDRIRGLKPSARGELEVTDLNNSYLIEGKVGFKILEGFWSDAGTVTSRRRCEEMVLKGLEKEIINSLPDQVRKKILL